MTDESGHAIESHGSAGAVVGQSSEQLGGRSPRGGLAALVIAAGVFNVLMMPLLQASSGPFSTYVLEVIVTGVLPGQVGAMALWLVWGEGPFLRRLAMHWGIGLLLVLCMALGSTTLGGVAGTTDFWRQAANLLGVLPALSLAAQLPLWPLRTYFGWSVERLGPDLRARQSAPLSILDILSGTAVVGVSLGLVRAVSPFGGGYLLPQIGVPLGVIFVASLICLLPLTLFILRPRESRVGVGMLAGYIFLTVFGMLGIAGVLTRSFVPAGAFFLILLMCFSFAGTLAAPLLVLRRCGYRLVWPRDRRGGNTAGGG